MSVLTSICLTILTRSEHVYFKLFPLSPIFCQATSDAMQYDNNSFKMFRQLFNIQRSTCGMSLYGMNQDECNVQSSEIHRSPHNMPREEAEN